jgi:hypothetical protein
MRRVWWISISGVLLVASCTGCVATIGSLPYEVTAVTVGPVVLTTAEGRRNAELMCHEQHHVAQWRADPWRFWVRYGLETLKHGYKRNAYEVEARKEGRKCAAS